MNICTGQLWANRKTATVMEIVGRDDRRPHRWWVLLHSSEATVSFDSEEITSRYQLRA